MGRRRISPDDKLFRLEVSQKLKAAMREHDLTESDVARELGISRQAVNQYVNAKSTPQGDILARACAKWGIRLRFRGAEFSGKAFGAAFVRSEPDVLQMGLFKDPVRLGNDDVEVVLERSRKSTLRVTIRMKKAEGRRHAAKAVS